MPQAPYFLKSTQKSGFESYWKDRMARRACTENETPLLHRSPSRLQLETFAQAIQPQWLEIGAGSGTFFSDLSKVYPDTHFVAIERARFRALRLQARQKKHRENPNFHPLRGNALTLFYAFSQPVWDRVFILYPCPWPKRKHQKNRWHYHPGLSALIATMKHNSALIIASDASWYIDEAHYVFSHFFEFHQREASCPFTLQIEASGPLSPNAWNEGNRFPQGRTHFEKTFLAEGKSCYELVVRKKSCPI